jgi:hypothetical protein
VCIGCAAWLHKQSLPIVHTIHRPFWRRLTPHRCLLASGADLHATPGYSDQTAAQIAADPGTSGRTS